MIGMKLLVRNLEAFAQSTSEKLRTEESIYREEEREILLNDERMNLRKLKREKDDVWGKGEHLLNILIMLTDI